MTHAGDSAVTRRISGRVRSRMVQDRRGTVATLVALSAIPMMLAAGLALDATRLWLLQTRLQEAVDASVLLAASPSEASASTATATTDTSNLFWANFGRVSRSGNPGKGFINTGFMGATVSDTALAVTFPDSTHVQVAATAALPMTFMQLAGSSTRSVSASATAQRAGGVEMALVLDISLSMIFPMGDGTNNDKEQALQAAAAGMLSALYGGNDTVPNLWLSVVPFAGAVNIGNSHTNWLDSSFASRNPAGAVTYGGSTADGSGWRGCVEARQGGQDLTESSPTTAPFAPFYWPSTYQQYPKAGGGYYSGDNDWTASTITDTNSANQVPWGTGIPKGPNLGCPHSALLPLTASKTTVSNEISNFTLTNPIGTVVVQGLQWGWFTLSPSWQGSSGWNLTTPGGASLPLNYASPNNTKVIVLMTDGTTDVSGAETFYGAANSRNGNQGPPACDAATIAPECISSSGGTNTPKSADWATHDPDADSWYSPYGRVSAGRVISHLAPTNNPAIDSENATDSFSGTLDNKVTTLCSSIKQQGIIIFTIFFHGPDDDAVDAYLGSQKGTASASSILQNCATDSHHFFDATSSAAISSAFVTIANQIEALRLTH